jgi:hypothetical protein
MVRCREHLAFVHKSWRLKEAVDEFVRGVRPFCCSIEEGEALANEDIGWCPKACPANASPLQNLCRGEA